MLKINNLSLSFGLKKIIKNLSFSANRGTVSLFLGSSGVGKSTLLRVLAGLEKAESGSIFFDDHEADLAAVNKNHEVGMVFQNFNLFSNMNVIDNISIPLQQIEKAPKHLADELALELLQAYHLADKARLPVSKLSGGQKQRLALARAQALKPTIICMDEPTSALDPLLTAHVAQTITNLAHQGYIILVATHDTFLLEKLACTIYLMRGGSIVETATSHDYWNNPEQFSHIDAFVKGHKQPAAVDEQS